MNTYVKSIEFGFENTEVAEIPSKYIGNFYIDKIHTVFNRTTVNSIEKKLIADEVFIEIFGEVDEFGYDLGCDSQERGSVLERITRYEDIVCVEIKYEDDTSEKYWVDYDIKDGHEQGLNILQKAFISKAGNLYVLIGKDLKFEDRVDLKQINDLLAMERIKRAILHSGE